MKRLEELGIGRPSTYASILQVLQDRDYVKLDNRRFIPESRGRIVTTFLINFFKKYVEYNFTANLEEQLDSISAGEIAWKKVLREFWDSFSEAVGKTTDLKISDVITALEQDLEPILFPDRGPNARVCPQCKEGNLSLKLGKFGAFVGCSRYPDCRYTRPVLSAGNGDGDTALFRPGSDVIFRSGESRTIVEVRQTESSLWVYLEGAPLDPALVGLPSTFVLRSTEHFGL